MKRNLLRALLYLCAAMLLSATAFADSGPKPSVNVTLRGLNGERWYATLLSATDSTGPYSAFGKFGGETPKDDDPAWRAFQSYEDADGYYFLQFTAEGAGDGGFRWTYYPPQRFKVLLYFPDSGAYAVSGIAERYAFDSYYAVDLRDAVDGTVPVVKSWDYGRELAGLAFRVVLTVAVELAVALLFGYRDRRYLAPVLRINLVTQLLLNVALTAAARYGGTWMAALAYPLLELAVFLIEAAYYRARFDGKGRPVLYALSANAASFAAGVLLARVLPGIF